MADRLVILLPKMIILSQMDRACFTVLATLQDRGLCTWLPAQVAVEHLLHSLGLIKTSREEDGCPRVARRVRLEDTEAAAGAAPSSPLLSSLGTVPLW